MLVSRKLLNRYVEIDSIETKDLAETLTNAGLEVEGIEALVSGNNLVVGHVLSCVEHEDSDHLNLCKVDVGDEILPIVCGADNVAKDQMVIVAKVGAVLDGGFEIKESVIRGEKSEGMICSLKELGIPEKFHPEPQTGIFVLDKGEPGEDAIEVLGMRDEIMDIKQTPNRSDFMALSSIAKEVAALYEANLKLPSYEPKKIEESPTELSLNLKTKLSQQFLGKVVNKVTIKESPDWIKEALIASGMRPINNLVDISNIVMLETGQPIHFYDKDFLQPLSISVVDNFDGEVKGLDDEVYQLQSGDQIIMNESTPIGIAGVMGLENSMIMDDTTSIVIEVASFDRVAVRHTSKRLGISSEASLRFSKPMDPKAPFSAMNRAIELLIEYAGAEQFEETIQAGNIQVEEPKILTNTNKINRLLGTEFSEEEILDVFNRLNLKPEIKEKNIEVTSPSYRRDLEIPEDLAEEVIRILGYDRLDQTLPKVDLTVGTYSEEQTMLRDIESMALAYGADQVVTYTLVNKEAVEGILSIGKPIRMMSPLSENHAYLRTNLLPSLLETLTYNKARKSDKNFYFEESRIYSEDKRENHFAMIGDGYVNANTWLKDSIQLDFFYLKGMLLEMMENLGIQSRRFTFEEFDDESETFNPFKSAKIYFDRKFLGVLGHLHPKYLQDKDSIDPVYLEINLDLILNAKRGKVKAKALAKHHDIVRDIAVLVNKEIKADELIKTMEKASKRSIKSLSVFDVFESEDLGDNKSIAFNLKFDGDKITKSEDIKKILENIEKELINKHQAVIR